MRELKATIPNLPVDEPVLVTRHGRPVAVLFAIPDSIEPVDFARGLAARAVELREASDRTAIELGKRAKPAKK